MFDLIIKNALCVLPHKIEKADVGILGEKILEIGDLSSRTTNKVFDAEGLHCFPGLIDTQVHFREPGLTHKEDIESGSKGALLGGVTTFFEMPNTNPLTTTEETLKWKVEKAKETSYTDFAFFIGGTAENFSQLEILESLPGCAGVKIFMGSSTGSLLVDDDQILEKIIQNGERRLSSHCEDEKWLQDHIELRDYPVHNHQFWRSEEAALIATKKLVTLSKKYKRPIHILHVSSKGEVEYLHKNKSPFATVEVTPQHLSFGSEEIYDTLINFAQMNPPIRSHEHREALWKAVANGTIDIIGSDHAPHTIKEKEHDYPDSHSGMPGVQTILPVMLTHASEGRIDFLTIARLCSENPAKAFKIKDKGKLEAGCDADIVLVDTKRQQVIEQSWLKSKCRWSPYEGMLATGWPVATFLRGQLIVSDGEIIKRPKGKAVEFT